MPLPRYQPVKKKPKISAPSLDDLDDFCLAKVIAHALTQSKWRQEEPYVGDNGATERRLSLVSKRWYFLTQSQVGQFGVHRIHLEEVLKRESRPRPVRTAGIVSTTVKTPRRPPPMGLASGIAAPAGARTPAGSFKLRPNYGVLSQRNLTGGPPASQLAATTEGYDIQLFRAIQPKLLKYKHVQLCGTITSDNFGKLLIALGSSRVERLDLLGVKIENAKCALNNPKLFASAMLNSLSNLDTLTYTISTSSKDDPTNALLWTIYQRAINLRELQVYLNEVNPSAETVGFDGGPNGDQTVTKSFIEQLISSKQHRSHYHLARIVFMRLAPAIGNELASSPTVDYSANYSALIKKVLAEEKSVASLDTNDPSLMSYLIQASNRLCTRPSLRRLILSCSVGTLELLEQLIRLQNLGTEYLSLVLDNFEQIGEVKVIMDNFKLNRPAHSRCVLNLYLKDQKFTDCEDKVKNLVQLSRSSDINVYISALQRISIDCCHLMWSTGRALQAMSSLDSAGKCIFQITLQTYPVKPNTINPFEITIPFGRCSQYKISSIREDVVRHREIMKSLKKDCYHQFVKSVRESNSSA